MVNRWSFLYCARLIPPGEEHYVRVGDEWRYKAYVQLDSYCAACSPDPYGTCEMCKQCARRNGIEW